MKSKSGLVFVSLYLLVCLYLILSDGLFGESFIVIVLGLPWILPLAATGWFEETSGVLIYVMLFLPIFLNALVLYFVGLGLSRVATFMRHHL